MNFSLKMNLKGSFYLDPEEVHIWSACLSENDNKILYYASLLSQNEQKRVSSFQFRKDQSRYIISRGILRCLLGRYLEEEPKRIDILYGFWGKPCLLKEKSLFFNLSHSGDYILYSFARWYEVGIDVEYVDTTLELENMARSVLLPDEFLYWYSLPPKKKIRAFFKYWTAKESFLKAREKGWVEDQSVFISFETLIKLNNDPQKRNSLKTDKVTYPYCFEPIPNYPSALYIEGPSLYPRHFIWSPKYLSHDEFM